MQLWGLLIKFDVCSTGSQERMVTNRLRPHGHKLQLVLHKHLLTQVSLSSPLKAFQLLASSQVDTPKAITVG